MTEDELTGLENCVERIPSEKLDAIFFHMYEQLLHGRHQEVAELFEGSVIAHQIKMFRMMMVHSPSLLKRSEAQFSDTLKQLGENHVKYGVKPADYEIMRDAFITSLESSEFITNEELRLWSLLFQKISEEMQKSLV